MRFPNRSETNRPVQPETGNFGFRKKRHCTIRLAKTKALNSFAVTTKLICAFVFAYAVCWFSYDAAHISQELIKRSYSQNMSHEFLKKH